MEDKGYDDKKKTIKRTKQKGKGCQCATKEERVREILLLLAEEVGELRKELRDTLSKGSSNRYELVEEKVEYLVKEIEERKAIGASAKVSCPEPDHVVIQRTVTPIFRVMTNGKEYRVARSNDDGLSWLPEQELIAKSRGGKAVRTVSRRTQWGAARYVRELYGTKATILSRKWVQV